MAILYAVTLHELLPTTVHGVGVVPGSNWWKFLVAAVVVNAFVLLNRSSVHELRKCSPIEAGLIMIAFVSASLLFVELSLRIMFLIGIAWSVAAFVQLAFPAVKQRALQWFMLTFALALGTVSIVRFLRLRTLPSLEAAEVGSSIQSFFSGIFVVNHDGIAHSASLTFEKCGGYVPVVFLVITLFYVARFRERLLAVKLTLVTVLYSVLRGLWLIYWISEQGVESKWWESDFLLITFLPLVGICCAIVFFATIASRSCVLDIRPASTGFLLASFAGSFLTCCGLLLEDPGERKNGRVMIDERYSDWEWSEIRPSMSQFGVASVYNYSSFKDTLSEKFDVLLNYNRLTEESLKGVSVLILKTPTEPYDADAIKAIDKFVRKGGGLWLIGEHTDIFGINSYLNEIARRFGMEFQADAVIDVRENRQLVQGYRDSHPVMARVPLTLLYTGCSIKGSWRSRTVVVTEMSLSDTRSMSQNTFFGNLIPDLSDSIGPVGLSFATHVGEGRVMTWSDSTMFSVFSMYMPGKAEFSWSAVDWLDRSNRFDFRLLVGIPGLLILIVVVILKWGAIPIEVFSVMVVGFALAMTLATSANFQWFPIMEVEGQANAVHLISSKVDRTLPIAAPAHDEGVKGQYLSWYVGLVRNGLRPIVTSSEQMEDVSDRAVVLGQSDVLRRDLNGLVRFVKSGGKAVLLDIGVLGNVGIWRVLREFDLESVASTVYSEPKAVQIVDEKGNRLGSDMVGCGLKGGVPVLSTDDGLCVAARFPVGAGSLTIVATSDLFSDYSLGDVSVVPNARQIAVLQMIPKLFE